MAGAGFKSLLLICLLNLTLTTKLASHTLQFALKYHVFLNSLWAQIRDHIHCSLRCGGHILYCSRIRKNVTENTQTDREPTDRESNYRDHSNRQWIVVLSGPVMTIMAEGNMNFIVNISYSKTTSQNIFLNK